MLGEMENHSRFLSPGFLLSSVLFFLFFFFSDETNEATREKPLTTVVQPHNYRVPSLLAISNLYIFLPIVRREAVEEKSKKEKKKIPG